MRTFTKAAARPPSGSAEMARRPFLKGAGALALAAASGLLLAGPVQARSVARAGGRELLSFSDGAITLPAGMAAMDRPRDELARTLRAGGFPADQLVMPLNVTAVRDGENYIFMDCGSGQRFLKGSGQLAKAVEAAGINSEKVTHVLFTHAHPDHMWGAVDEFDEPFFPNARYMISQADRDFWLAKDTLSKLPQDRQFFVAGARRIIKTLGDRLTTFTPGKEIVSGIAAVDTAGHTPGHVSFDVKLGSEAVMVLGDAILHPLISFRHPAWKPGADQLPDIAVKTRQTLLDRLASEKRRFVGYHLPGTGAGRTEKKDGAYRFIPA